jgi:hypothetical protein
LDYRRYKEDGFRTPLEMFDFLMECKYCSMISFTQENINTVHRRRLTHRPIYQQYIEYITSHPLVPSQPALPYLTTPTEHTNYLLSHFQCSDAYEEIIRRDEETRIVKSKFNGGIVTGVTGLEGKEIGKLIVAMKEHILKIVTSDSKEVKTDVRPLNKKDIDEIFHQYLLPRSEEEIISFIQEVHQEMLLAIGSS